MSPLTAADLPPLEVFEAERATMRARVIAHKARRRVALGLEHLERRQVGCGERAHSAGIP